PSAPPIEPCFAAVDRPYASALRLRGAVQRRRRPCWPPPEHGSRRDRTAPDPSERPRPWRGTSSSQPRASPRPANDRLGGTPARSGHERRATPSRVPPRADCSLFHPCDGRDPSRRSFPAVTEQSLVLH